MKTFEDSLLPAALERYHFDRESGQFFHVIRDMNNQPVITGKFAGTVTPTGIRLTVGNRHVMAHHLAWRIFEGEWPIANVKHRDGDVMNCKASNLYSPMSAKVKGAKRDSEAKMRAEFMKSIGITKQTIQDALLRKIRDEKGEKAYIEYMHILGRINDEEKAAMLLDLRKADLGFTPSK